MDNHLKNFRVRNVCMLSSWQECALFGSLAYTVHCSHYKLVLRVSHRCDESKLQIIGDVIISRDIDVRVWAHYHCCLCWLFVKYTSVYDSTVSFRLNLHITYDNTYILIRVLNKCSRWGMITYCTTRVREPCFTTPNSIRIRYAVGEAAAYVQRVNVGRWHHCSRYTILQSW